MTILIVDSDRQLLEKETERLTRRQSGVTVSLHSSADDAIKFAMYHDVDIVFARKQLKDMTGQELAEKIRLYNPEAECHILLEDEEIPFDKFAKTPRDSFRVREKSGNAPPDRCIEEDRPHIHRTDAEKKRVESDGCSCRNAWKRGDQTMTEQELRGLGRKALLEIMLEQGKEMETCKEQYEKDLEFLKSQHEKDMEFLKDEYEREISSLKEELDKAQKKLQDREIAINEAGSIAVAALQINGIFEAAQAASQQYIENIRSLNERQASICAQRDAENRAETDRRLRETEEKCTAMEYASRKKCEEMEREAKEKSEAYWTEVSGRLQSFYDNHQELRRLLNFGTPGIRT